MRRLRLPFTTLAVVLALAALSGCGASKDPLVTVRTAAKRTLGLTAQSALTLSRATLFGGQPRTIFGRGQFSFPDGLGYAALQLPALDGQAAGTAYLVYQRSRLWSRPAASTGLPHGDLWISSPFASPRSEGSTTPSLALVLEATNPQLLLAEIATGASFARSAGHRVVDHVPFTEYRVTIDVPRALEAVGRSGALRSAMQQQSAALRGSQFQVVARVDGQGRVAQLEATFPGSRLGTVQLALSGFGRPIPLSLPLASETVDIGALRRSRGAVTAAWTFTGA